MRQRAKISRYQFLTTLQGMKDTIFCRGAPSQRDDWKTKKPDRLWQEQGL